MKYLTIPFLASYVAKETVYTAVKKACYLTYRFNVSFCLWSGILRLTSWLHNQEEQPMPSFGHGTKVGGRFVIQHQTQETMAAVLLAWEGDYTVKWKSVSASDTKYVISVS